MAAETDSPRTRLRNAISFADLRANGSQSPSPSPPLPSMSPRSRSISPSPARLSCPPLYRDFSDTSSASTLSTRSSNSRSVSGSAAVRRRGYVRPQGASFAQSAKNRESVMSLGSIAHLQYYFARTGLLDGKGAQARDIDVKKRRRTNVAILGSDDGKDDYEQSVLGEDYVGSPVEGDSWVPDEYDEEMMLPPTVSTYAQRIPNVEPPPDPETLRRELTGSLEKLQKALKDIREHNQEEKINSRWSTPVKSSSGPRTPGSSPSKSPSKRNNTASPSATNGWHQISGMHMLDVATLAIRAAKDYYTQHDQAQRLHQIKSERKIREELLQVMDVLKRMAARNFQGGMRDDETTTVGDWAREVGEMLVKERRIEAQEARDRKSWRWLAGSWPPEQARTREHEFMKTFLQEGEEMPRWEAPTPGAEKPSAMLDGLKDGLILVTLHNRILKMSKRKDGEIKNFHTDTTLPYRAAENLRFWIKAAELRWEVKIQLDVMGVVHGKGEGIWEQFDAAVMEWCRSVREEITAEWKQGSVQVPPPIVIAAPTPQKARERPGTAAGPKEPVTP